ncbi:MAG: hypothetical protein N2255_06755, partial [Kiritimatiellae bacterium]|nr:hypothetical protein [Kiritimatiellia bacterium]
VGGCPAQFLAQGDDIAMAHLMTRAGWKVLYDPNMYVYHKPHTFWRQIVQVYRFGRAAKRLERAGLGHPRKDAAYYLFLPVYFLFALSYILGMLRELVFGTPKLPPCASRDSSNGTGTPVVGN